MFVRTRLGSRESRMETERTDGMVGSKRVPSEGRPVIRAMNGCELQAGRRKPHCFRDRELLVRSLSLSSLDYFEGMQYDVKWVHCTNEVKSGWWRARAVTSGWRVQRRVGALNGSRSSRICLVCRRSIECTVVTVSTAMALELVTHEVESPSVIARRVH